MDQPAFKVYFLQSQRTKEWSRERYRN